MTDLPGLFVVGTDTGVGKTRVAAAIARALVLEGHRVGVLKPAATGATKTSEGWRVDDAEHLIEAVGGGVPTEDVCPIAFAEPLAPPIAARRSGRLLIRDEVERATFAAIERWRAVRGASVMVVEGVGGLLCPLAEGMTVADLAVRLDYPLVVVARRGLGTLNHTLLTVEAATSRSLRVAGVILNGSEPTADPVAEATNPAELARRLGPIPILADLPHVPEGGRSRPMLSGWGGDDSRRHHSLDGEGVTSYGSGWYNRAKSPRVSLPRPDPRSTPMSSSSDLIRPGSSTEGSDVDLDAFPVPPLPLDDVPSLDISLSSSGDGEGPRPSSSSSAFSLPTGLITPDPILAELAPVEAAAPPMPLPPHEMKASVIDEPSPPRPEHGGTIEALGGLNFDTTATPSPPAPRKSAPMPKPAAPAEVGEDGVEIEYVNGPNWPMVLLASYASAATLALIWFVILPRFRDKGDLDVVASPAPAVGTRRADRSRKVEPAAAIPGDRMVSLGKALRVGSLEITPIEVSRSGVALRRRSLTGSIEERDGGSGALSLRVRLRNTSGDAVFAPLDESFLRDRDDGLPDSFVEVGPSTRVYLYPLPVDSEWSIVGQDFPDLRPGEVGESRIVTAADFPASASGMTWRLKVRTGPDATAVVGVSAGAGE